ncbi:DUF805 domain-containing protein [Pleomorphomonas oryzae]|uniref:DUF805 domain-containing protein n=1 Tax=Pleomorphomonas oryzae TaxID=261934 RepID=UPI0003FFAE23|nr:DUF805 domain-containing protein [Pleomorphomonas oryzae]
MLSTNGSEWLAVLLVLIWVLIPIPVIIKRPPTGPNRFGEAGLPMEFGQAIRAYFSNYAKFEGRASRSEFWWTVLFVFVVGIATSFIPFVNIAWSLVTIVPSISLAARRLHDINRSGWLQLLAMSFPIGTVAVIVWYCQLPREPDDLMG